MRDSELGILTEGGEIIHPDEIDDEASHENCEHINACEPNASNNYPLVLL